MSLTEQQFDFIRKVAENNLDLARVAFEAIVGDDIKDWVNFIIEGLLTANVQGEEAPWYNYDHLYIFSDYSFRFHDSWSYATARRLGTGVELPRKDRPTKFTFRYKGKIMCTCELTDNELVKLKDHIIELITITQMKDE